MLQCSSKSSGAAMITFVTAPPVESPPPAFTNTMRKAFYPSKALIYTSVFALMVIIITRWKFRVTWPFNQYKSLRRKCRCQLDFHLQAPRAPNQPTCLPGADREAWGGLDHLQVHDHPHPHLRKQTFKSGQHYIEKQII